MTNAYKIHSEIDHMIQHVGDIYRRVHGKDDDGTLTVVELENALKAKKAKATDHQELYQLAIDHVKDIDRNHDGNISFLEFMRCCDRLKQRFGTKLQQFT